MAEAALTFEEFAAARLPAVLRFAAVLTGDRSVDEDVVQEVLIRASRRWETVAGLDRPEAYVRKMIVNEYTSWRRRSWRLVPSGAGTEVDGRLAPDDRLAPDPAAGHIELSETGRARSSTTRCPLCCGSTPGPTCRSGW
jgi:DNA-directed RNA polymerase specialized sigma24 family protein